MVHTSLLYCPMTVQLSFRKWIKCEEEAEEEEGVRPIVLGLGLTISTFCPNSKVE